MGILDQGTVSVTTFLCGIILARYCVKTEYGMYYLIITLLPLWDNLRLAFVSMPLTVFLPREKQHSGIIGASLVLICFLMLTGLICTGLGAVLISFLLHDHALAKAMSASSLMTAAYILQRYLRSVFHARLQNHYALMISILGAVLQLGGILLLNAQSSLTAVNSVLVIAAASLTASAAGLPMLSAGKRISFSRKAFWELWRKNREFGRWLLWKSIVYLIAFQSLPWILKVMKGSGEVAVFAACMAIVNGINPFWIGFTNILGAQISHAFAEKQIRGIRETVFSAQMILLSVTGLVTASICIFSEALLRLCYGGKYAGNGPVLAVLSVALLVNIATFALEQTLVTLEKTRTVYRIYLWVLCLCTLPVFFMIREWGIKGVSAGYLLICFVTALLRIYYYYREIRKCPSYSTGPACPSNIC